ncbi:MAG TPA: hypothetical protein VFE54_14115 [Mucilaginibacter sp.]|jgi:hypothetical protein|nr:hypothetical protein [Mucilaginibacter sp.]
MNLFLRAKHWQIFLITFALPFVLQITLVATTVYNIIQNNDPSLILGYIKFLPLVIIVFMGGIFGWQWSVAIGLQKKIPAGINMKVTQFKIFFFIPVVYMLLFSVFISSMFNADIFHGGQPDPRIFYLFPIIFPLHLFAMFCLFYCIYFVAKTIKTVELQREVTFNDFVAEFFLTWFHFIGIWILQPRINKMAEENTPDLAELKEM